jgi:hypothetical protein
MIALAVCLLLSQTDELEAPAAVPAAEPAAEIDKAFAEETPRQVRITLNDGRVISGKLLLRDELQLLVQTEGGQPVSIDADDVKRFEEPLPNRNRSRYLFASSALMPEPGQVSVTQIQVLATLLEVGVSQNFSFTLGTSVPAFFLGRDGVNAYAAVKAGLSFTRWVHLALELKFLALGLWSHIGGTSIAVPAGGVVAVTLTAGGEDLNVTLSGGPQFDLTQLNRQSGQVVAPPLVTLSAFVRVHPNVGLITENWVIPEVDLEKHWFVADALAARFFGERFAIDLGILVMPTQFLIVSPVPGVLPWLNFTYHFT